MNKNTGNNTSLLLAEADQIIKDTDYKQQLLSELLGQLKQPSGQITPVHPYDEKTSPLANARALIAERNCQFPVFNHALESSRYRRPLALRGLLI
ncbi:hypothetical protein D3C77_251640 [compost metagenome]